MCQQAQNLRDSGCNVIVGQRPGSPNYDLAVSHGFEPMPIDEATKRGDLINLLLPDEVQGDILINNTIGFLGTKQHAISEDGTGFTTEYRQDLLKSTDSNSL